MRLLFFLIILCTAATAATAQELSLLGGVLTTSRGHGTYSWMIEYLQGLGENFGCSLSYLNEGHVPVHHRDGNTVQLWVRHNFLDRRLSVAVGAGPYYYFDTTRARTLTGHVDDHGWAGMYSGAVTWYSDSRWLAEVRLNLVEAPGENDTFSGVAGIGYQLDAPPVRGPLTGLPVAETRRGTEVTVFGGRTIVNSFNSDQSAATSVELRQGVAPYLDLTAAWLYEGDSRLVRRNGFTGELWLVRSFLDEAVALGAGAGAYFAIDRYRGPAAGQGSTVAGIVTLTAAWRVDRHWGLRSSWNRVVTTYDRDTDVLLGGVGYRF